MKEEKAYSCCKFRNNYSLQVLHIIKLATQLNKYSILLG